MGFEIIDLVGNMFISVFGSPYIVMAVITFFLIILLAVMKADLVVMLMVLVPFFIGIGLNAASTDIINLPTWIILMVFMIMGFVFAMFILFLMR